MYAIIETGGKQYKVQVGDLVKVEKLDVNVGDKVTFDKVLAVCDNEITLGNPTVSGKTVTGTCTKQAKDKKVIVYKYKRKSGYHKKNGHRQLFTEVKIDSI
jgi:large subunit ribosomal protein L21